MKELIVNCKLTVFSNWTPGLDVSGGSYSFAHERKNVALNPFGRIFVARWKNLGQHLRKFSENERNITFLPLAPRTLATPLQKEKKIRPRQK